MTGLKTFGVIDPRSQSALTHQDSHIIFCVRMGERNNKIPLE